MSSLAEEERDHRGKKRRGHSSLPYRLDVNSHSETCTKTRSGQVYPSRPRLAVVFREEFATDEFLRLVREVVMQSKFEGKRALGVGVLSVVLLVGPYRAGAHPYCASSRGSYEI
jgi:hypothetical protein